MDFELAYTYLIKQRPFGLRSTWDPNALSSRYFIKLSIRSQRSMSVEYGQRSDFATIDRRSYGYKVSDPLTLPERKL